MRWILGESRQRNSRARFTEFSWAIVAACASLLRIEGIAQFVLTPTSFHRKRLHSTLPISALNTITTFITHSQSAAYSSSFTRTSFISLISVITIA